MSIDLTSNQRIAGLVILFALQCLNSYLLIAQAVDVQYKELLICITLLLQPLVLAFTLVFDVIVVLISFYMCTKRTLESKVVISGIIVANIACVIAYFLYQRITSNNNLNIEVAPIYMIIPIFKGLLLSYFYTGFIGDSAKAKMCCCLLIVAFSVIPVLVFKLFI
ncbi:MAG: hypothetical protein QM632_04755 [Micrococcaceae bacterium]